MDPLLPGQPKKRKRELKNALEGGWMGFFVLFFCFLFAGEG